jgi:hypothetical protein
MILFTAIPKYGIFLIIFLTLYSSGLSQSNQNQPRRYDITIHMFVLCQQDPNVGVITDFETVKRLSQQIQNDLSDEGVNIGFHSYLDESFSISNFKNDISKLNIGKNDVLWFYYTGHGRNFNAWPETHDSQTPLTEVHKTLKETGARLAITMFDCCNWDTTISKPVTIPFCDDGPNFENLFLFSKGDIMISAAQPGKFAFGRVETGSIFTNSIYSNASCTNSWQDWLKSSRKKTTIWANQMGKQQDPIYLFNKDFLDGTFH